MATALQQGTFVRAFNGADAEKDGVIPEFYMDAPLNQQASAEAGHPVYTEREMVKMILMGNPHLQPHEQVNDSHRARWPQQYAQFKAGLEQAADGYPIEQWPPISIGWVRRLKSQGIRTVENIAQMSDQMIQSLGMGAHQLRENARGFLADAKDMAPLTAANAKLEKQDQLLIEQNAKISELTALVDSLGRTVQAMQNAPRETVSVSTAPMVQTTQIPAVPFSKVAPRPQRQGRNEGVDK